MHLTRTTASRPRCLAVAAGVTAAIWGVAAVPVRALASGGTGRTPDQALVQLCLAALVLAAAWAWLQALAGVADAWRGAGTARGGVVRRLALVACGVALAGALAGPAHAEAEALREPDPIAGLPLPDRPTGGAGGTSDKTRVVVRAGDSLWALAERDLTRPAGAAARPSDREITDRWRAVYAANRAVVGPDPDLIRPGQVLRLSDPAPKEER